MELTPSIPPATPKRPQPTGQTGGIPKISPDQLTGTGTTLTGDVTGSGVGSFATTIASNVVGNTKLRDSVALSVIGRSPNSGGDPADIAASSDGDILRRSGTTLGFGTILAASVSDFSEASQDAVGSILVDSSEINFTYDDATPSITASLVAGSIDETKLDASVNTSLDLADSASQPGHTHTKSDLTDIADFLLESEVDADIKTLSLPASTTISAFGATLVDDADAATARATLGLVAGGTGDIWVEKAGDTMTGNLTISNTAPSLVLTDTTASAKGLTIAVDANVAEIRESAAAAGTLLALDLTNSRVGIGTSAPGYKFEAKAAITSASANPVALFTNTSSGNFVLGMNNSGSGNSNFAFYIDGAPTATVGYSRASSFLGFLNAAYSGNDFILKINSDGSMTYNNGSTSTELIRMNIQGNIGVGTSTFGTSATNTLALLNGTSPTTSPADMIQIFSKDISAGNASLGLRTETAVTAAAAGASDAYLNITVNGTIYKLLLHT